MALPVENCCGVCYSDYEAVINTVIFYSAVQQNRNTHNVALAGTPYLISSVKAGQISDASIAICNTWVKLLAIKKKVQM